MKKTFLMGIALIYASFVTGTNRQSKHIHNPNDHNPIRHEKKIRYQYGNKQYFSVSQVETEKKQYDQKASKKVNRLNQAKGTVTWR